MGDRGDRSTTADITGTVDNAGGEGEGGVGKLLFVVELPDGVLVDDDV
jgi:hypothetical protein